MINKYFLFYKIYFGLTINNLNCDIILFLIIDTLNFLLKFILDIEIKKIE